MTNSGTQIAVAIVIAALILLVGGIGYVEFKERQAVRAVQSGVQQLEQQAAAVNRERRDAGIRQRQATAAEVASRKLRSGERCIGETVVIVSESGYQQLLERGRPVKCSGVHRTR